MGTGDLKFAGAIPEIYDRYMVPLIFEPYARDLAARVAAERSRDVLETAAGSGVVTRALAPLLPADARYVVTDLNPPMLDRARAQQPPDDRIDWRQADATQLPFEAGTFDAVVCQFGTMFFPDRPRGFAEARRVLRPGGLFLFNTWDRISENPFPHVVLQALADLFPDDPPDFMERIPHGYHDAGRIAADMRSGGFDAVHIDNVTVMARAASVGDVAVAFCQGTPMRNEIEERGADLDRVTAVARARLAARFGEGPVEAPIRAHVVTARA